MSQQVHESWGMKIVDYESESTAVLVVPSQAVYVLFVGLVISFFLLFSRCQGYYFISIDTAVKPYHSLVHYKMEGCILTLVLPSIKELWVALALTRRYVFSFFNSAHKIKVKRQTRYKLVCKIKELWLLLPGLFFPIIYTAGAVTYWCAKLYGSAPDSVLCINRRKRN
jgi:hypothetical protein